MGGLHRFFEQLSDLGLEIEKAREDLFEACEKSHLVNEDPNPTMQKDCAMASETYSYAKQHMAAPFFKEIMREMATFQKKVNNARIKIEALTKRGNGSPSCCSACSKNCEIKQILLSNYFKQDERYSPISYISSFGSLNTANSSSSGSNESLSFSSSSIGSV